ncbi:MAG: hypothetical protein AABX16_05230 [Nanoarchaeota archaeon]
MQDLTPNKNEELKLNSEFIANAVVKLMKQDILARYMKTREITDEDWEFCEKIDWHPVDELPPKPEHLEELKRRLKEETGKTYNSAEEFFNDLDSAK